MNRTLILLALLATAPAFAQEALPASGDLPLSVLLVVEASGEPTVTVLAPEAAAQGPGTEERLALYIGGVAGSAIGPLLWGDTDEWWLTLVSVPVGSALGVHFTSQSLGLDGRLSGAAGNAVLGSIIGVGAGLGVAVLLCTSCVSGSDAYDRATWSAVATAVVVPGLFTAYRRIGLNARVRPTTVVAPTGEQAQGLSLFIRF